MTDEKAGAHFEQTSLFVSGEDGYYRYRIPALVVSTRGTILAFCEARKYTGSDDDVIDVALRRSFDGGRTWEPRQIIVADGDITCGNPCPVVDHSTGVIWLPFCKNNQQVFITRSEDDGVSWGAPVEITSEVKDPSWAYLGSGPGHGIQLQSGRLLIPSWCDESPEPATQTAELYWGKVQSSYAFFSDDHGATWKRGEKLTDDMSDECEAVETADGAVYMNMRSRQEKNCRAQAWSRDGGASWSKVEFDPNLPEPSCQAGLVRLTDQDSSSRSRVLLSHPSDTRERSRLKARLSYDECRTWSVEKMVYEGFAAYSDLAIAPDHTILCLYEADHARLVLARFNLEWLTDGADHP